MSKKKVFSGMRPTGRLHLGHLVGALENWVKMQDEYECVFGIVDWHALTSEYQNVDEIKQSIFDIAVDWMSSDDISHIRVDSLSHKKIKFFCGDKTIPVKISFTSQTSQ